MKCCNAGNRDPKRHAYEKCCVEERVAVIIVYGDWLEYRSMGMSTVGEIVLETVSCVFIMW